MIFAILGAAIALAPGQQVDAALQVGSAPEALSACQAQRAAANGMSAEVFVGSDGSFLIYCRLPHPAELAPVALEQGPPPDQCGFIL